MTALIVEDEPLAAEKLIKMLSAEDESIQVTGPLDTVEKAVSYLKENPAPDIIFLDMEVEVNSHIIFITAFDEYALRAFKYNSIDYLLKPLKRKDLSFALDKFRQHFSFTQSKSEIAGIIRQLQQKEYRSRFLLRQGTRLFSVHTNEVAIAYTRERLHYIRTFSDAHYLIDNNLDELEEQLDPEKFFRVNRQFIVSFNAIDQAYAWFDGKIKLMVKPAAYEDIIISRLRANDFKKWMGK
jgi:two-component system LytT family response regulator